MLANSDKLISGCIDNDRKAQMQFYQQYYKMIYNSCFRILQKQQEAEDTMQESFLKAFTKLNTIGNAPVEAWLRRIAINTSLDKLKKKQTHFIELNEQITVYDDEVYDEEDLSLKVQQIKDGINELPNQHRIILTLHLLEGYDYEEIADILNNKPGTIRAQYLRAKQKLIESLKAKK